MDTLECKGLSEGVDGYGMCTIFTASLGGRALFGNNEDNERQPNETFIAFIPSQEIPTGWSSPGEEGIVLAHGFMLVGVITGNRLFPQGGVNDQGLCYDINGLPPVSFNGHEGKPWKLWFNSFDLLWNCTTVSEVKDWFLSHQLISPTWYGGQYHFADATGDAFVLGIGSDGNYAFTEKGDSTFLVSTNFNLANHEENTPGYPCKRYDVATKMLKEIDNENKLTVSNLSDILNAVHVEYKNGVGTVYSNIFDLVNRKAYVYHLHNFDEVVEFDLDYELSRMDSNETSKQFGMEGGDLFQKFRGLRIYTIEDLFEK